MSLATIQIKPYDYLESQRFVSPQVNDDMLGMAGNVYHNVDLTEINLGGYLDFSGWSWRKEWFTVLDPVAKPLTEQDLDLSHTLMTALNNQDFPEDLEYIQIASDPITTPTSIELAHFTLKIVPSDSSTQMYFKFKGATAYNVSNYLGMSSRRLNRSAEQIVENYGNGRNKELYVAQTLIAIYKGVEAWANIYRQAKESFLFTNEHEILLYANNRFDSLDSSGSMRWVLPSIFQRGSYELRTMAMFVATIHNIKATVVGLDDTIKWDKIDLLNPPFDDSKAYIKRYDGLLPVNRAVIESLVPVVKSKILGFYMVGRDDIEQRVFEIVFRSSWCPITQTNVYEPFDDALENLFKEAQVRGYINRHREIGVYYKGVLYHPNAIQSIKEREQVLEELGIDTSALNPYAQNGIEDYDFEPHIEFFGDSSLPHFGVELEVDKGGDDPDLSIIEKVLGVDFAYYMRDGSLDDGFEIATMPATLDYHMGHKRRYETAFKMLEEYGYRSHDTSTCGIHIHFDRTALGSTRATQNLKASFLALILEKNWNQVIKFSRRDFRRLEQWAKNQKLVGDIYHDDDEAAVVRKFNDKYANGDKYNALNCNHSKTFELRIFRGTLKANTFIATLQFVSNLVSVARECKTLDQAQRIKFEDIINYKSYDELNAYIAERNLNLEGGEQ
jgi:hypothetical protein